ncbi:hypothetical protein GOODEAATRI_030884, partial [Goodea atripinnis]
SAETPRRPSPQTPPPAPPGGAQGVPRPAGRHSPSCVSWAVPWASSRWDVPGTPQGELIINNEFTCELPFLLSIEKVYYQISQRCKTVFCAFSVIS